MTDGADGLETILTWLGWPVPVREYRFAPPRRWRFDLAWPERRIAVEVDGGTWVGGRHVRGAGYEADCVKLNEATIAGWRVLRVTSRMVEDGRAIDALQRLVFEVPV